LKVAVIGGAGRMGKWLIRYFLAQGHRVAFSDVRRDEAEVVAKSTGAALADGNLEAARDADLVVVATPIEVTPEALANLAPNLRRSSSVMEISSLKVQAVPVLRKAAERGLTALSIHPLFGPGIQQLTGEKIALVPVVDPASELNMVKSLFPEARIIIVDAEEHDKAMALTLSLPHFLNIVFASVVGDENLDVLKKLGGTTFKLQLVLSESVLSEDPGLYASIQMSNPYSAEYLEKLMSKALALRDHVVAKDMKTFSQFYRDIQASLSKDKDFAKAYERMYRALEAL